MLAKCQPWMCHKLFNQSFTDGHFNYFSFLLKFKQCVHDNFEHTSLCTFGNISVALLSVVVDFIENNQ